MRLREGSRCPCERQDIQHTAEKLATHLDIEDFKCSDGWLWCFRRRHDIANYAVTAELLSADASVNTQCNVVSSQGAERPGISKFFFFFYCYFCYLGLSAIPDKLSPQSVQDRESFLKWQVSYNEKRIYHHKTVKIQHMCKCVNCIKWLVMA